MRMRRDVLGVGAGAVASAIAGCLGRGGAQDDENPAAFASFFTLYDFTRHVGGDRLDAENAVPVGQHGHAWEPQADVLSDAVSSDAFVYLGIEDFQRWATDAAREIDANHDDVTLIDAVAEVDLREYDGGGDHHAAEDGHGGDHHENEDEHSDDHEHDGREYDPHFWVDPVLSARAVETIRDGLVDADPDGTEAYEENAAAYVADLEALHEDFEEGLAERDHDLVVVAGHDSYGYLSDRYDFEIHTPHGISPDDEPSPGRIADTVDLVEERGIEYVLYDRFDGDTLARTIADEAGGDVDVAPLSPAESVTEEWVERGWGYLEQMDEINRPSLEKALGATP